MNSKVSFFSIIFFCVIYFVHGKDASAGTDGIPENLGPAVRHAGPVYIVKGQESDQGESPVIGQDGLNLEDHLKDEDENEGPPEYDDGEPDVEMVANDPNVKDIQISKEWYEKNGCPHTETFNVDCNICDSCEAPGKQAKCSTEDCGFEKPIDDYQPGDICPEGQSFFSGCKICTCRHDGTDATCDDTPCRYYPNAQMPCSDSNSKPSNSNLDLKIQVQA